MLRRLLSRFPDALVGAASQAVGFVPIVSTTWFVARTDGLAAAGELTIQLGIAGAVFGVAQWGLRNMLLVEGTSRYSVREYVEARIAIALVAVVAVASIWLSRGALSWYAIAALAFKCGDACTDLRLAVIQLNVQSRRAFERVLEENVLKALIIVGAGLVAWRGFSAMAPATAIAAGIDALLSGSLLVRAAREASAGTNASRGLTFGRLATLLQRATPVALSTVACALLTSLPRALLHGAPSTRLGVAGVSLTIGGVTSLLFTSTWVIAAQRVRTGGWNEANLAALVRGYAKTTGWLLVAAPVLGIAVALVYGFPAGNTLYCAAIFASASLFYAGMGLSNMQKFTARREYETGIYLLGAATLAASIRVGGLDVSVAMILAGLVMAVLAIALARASLAPARPELA